MTARNINTSRHTAHDYLTPTLVPKFTDLRKRLECALSEFLRPLDASWNSPYTKNRYLSLRLLQRSLGDRLAAPKASSILLSNRRFETVKRKIKNSKINASLCIGVLNKNVAEALCCRNKY